MAANKLILDIFFGIVFLLVLSIYLMPVIAPAIIISLLLIAYYKLLTQNDFTIVLILILMSRCIMGPFIPGNSISFNFLNILCNYLPVTIYIFMNIKYMTVLNITKLSSMKWTVFYGISLIILSIVSFPFSIYVLPREVLPILLFLVLVLTKLNLKIDFDYLLKFFRYTFIASLIVYLLPNYAENLVHLLKNTIIFKEAVIDFAMYIKGGIPRNAGFVFDFRILGQLAVLYFLVLYYTKKASSFWDVLLLIVIAISTFSRGPILILVLVMALSIC